MHGPASDAPDPPLRGRGCIGAMRPNGVLINIGRGMNVDEAALITGI